MSTRSLILCLCGLFAAVTSLEDATAYIDHLFTYPLKLTDGSKVVQFGSDVLPSWLHYDESSHSLKGVPSKSEKGTIILEVTGKGESDVFAVSVLPNPSSVVAEPLMSSDRVVCKPHESITIVNVMLNADLDKLTAVLKSGIVENLAKHLTMKPNHIVLKQSNPDLFDSSALVQGVGDSQGDAGSVLSWIAGCGAVKGEQRDQLEQLESSAKDGSLRDAIKFGITSWQVSSKTLKPKGRRLKRQILTATPTPGTPTEVTPTTAATKDTVQPTLTTTESIVTTPTETPSTKPRISTPSTPLTTPSTPLTTPSTPPTTPPTPPTISPTPLTTAPTPPPSPTTPLTETTTTQEPTTLLTTTPDKPLETTKPLTVPPPITSSPPPLDGKPVRVGGSQEMKFNVTEGQLNTIGLSMVKNMFRDPEGEDLTFKLRFGHNSRDVNRRPTWIKFLNGVVPEITALPSADHIGENTFQLVAIDIKGQESDPVLVFINVVKADFSGIKQWYMIEIDTMSSPLGRYWDFIFKFVSKIQIDNLIGKVLLKQKQETEDKMIITVGDSSMKISDPCSSATREALRRLSDYKLTETTTVQITAVRVKVVSPCIDAPPVRNQAALDKFIDTLRPVLGVLFSFRLPDDLFYDSEDYDLKSLDIELLINGNPTTDLSWITYDKASWSLKGLLWESSNAQTAQFTLVAKDSNGQVVECDFDINVIQPNRVASHTFSVTLEMDYEKFANSRTQQIMLYEKLMEAFPGSQVVINKISPGSVIVELTLEEPTNYNESDVDSEPSYGCPDKVKAHTKSVYDDKNQVRPGFLEALTPYTVKQVDFTPDGECANKMDPISAQVKKTGQTGDGDDSKTMIIVIVVVVLVVIILAVIIVVVCIARRKKRAQHNVSKNNGQYIEKGVPVVFDEEMKDQKEPAEDQPLVSDKKPNPPAYPNGKSSGDGRGDYQPPTPPVSEPEESLA